MFDIIQMGAFPGTEIFYAPLHSHSFHLLKFYSKLLSYQDESVRLHKFQPSTKSQGCDASE